MTSHKFQSITESQWQSSTPGGRCAYCAEDYGHPVHKSSRWFTLVVEGYDPEYAQEIVKLTEESEMETSYAVIHALAVREEMKLRGWRLN